MLIVGLLLGSGVGLFMARTVKMTAIPQLVSVFNAVGGGAAALVAIADFIRLSDSVGAASITPRVNVTSVLDVGDRRP